MIVLVLKFLPILPCDAAEPWQLGFQDAATPMMQGIIDLHHDIFFFLILILVFVLWVLVRALWHFHYQKNPIPQRIVHGTTIEILWRKNCYMISEDDLELGQLRLLEVDNRVVVPAKSHLRNIVTSADVLHSWAVPSLGVKCDAVLGRLNQTSLLVQREGVYYGQCSEICGTAIFIFISFLILKSTSGLGVVFCMESHPSTSLQSSSGWTSFFERLEPWSTTESMSVNQPEAGPVPPGNPVASPGEEAGPANQPAPVVPYPYQPDEVIGGDCVEAIERRLLAKHMAKNTFPSSEDIRIARMKAEDLFEVKVEIIRLMAGLDPMGDWMGRGARALENPRTPTGEEHLDRLYNQLSDLERDGVRSSTYFKLKGRVFTRTNTDEHSSA